MQMPAAHRCPLVFIDAIHITIPDLKLLHALQCRLAGVHSINANASSASQPLMSHLNQEGQAVATAGPAGPQEPAAVADAPPDMGTCDPKYWSCPGAAGYKIRGLTYLKVFLMP